MSTIPLLKVKARDHVSLPGLGIAEFDGRGGVRFQFAGEEYAVRLSEVGLEERSFIALWCDAAARTIMIVNLYGEVAASIRLDDRAVSLTAVGRDAGLDTGFWRTLIVETRAGPLLVYEHGVIAFDVDGRVRWRAVHPTIDWSLLGVEGDRVAFENEFEGQWRYRLTDGRKEVVPVE